jgi:uncharacterized protein YggT (Ycf19 family)
MNYHYQQPTDDFAFHNQSTEPFVVSARQTRAGRVTHWLGRAITTLVIKINRLLTLALVVVWLLLLGRFLLTCFSLTHSFFSQWVLFITDPLMAPFNNLIPVWPYNGYLIDISTLVAMVVYSLAVIIVRRFLRILVSRE